LFRRFAAAFLIACAAITFFSMWARVRPRKYEIGVLRFLGASKILVIVIISTEAAVISFGGALLAVVISQSALTWLNLLTAAVPPYSIGFKWCLAASSTIVGAAMSGSTIPCAVSVQQDVLTMLEWDRA
jgi:ABC-type antimicrobial peptide transport system permease subunit